VLISDRERSTCTGEARTSNKQPVYIETRTRVRVNAALLEVNMVQSRRRSGDASERDWRAYSALAATGAMKCILLDIVAAADDDDDDHND